VDTAGGCKAAVHFVRYFIVSTPNDKAVVKLDYTNAFNCLYTELICSSQSPTVLQSCFLAAILAYASSSLLYGQYMIMSQEGPQQRGPLVHCFSAILYTQCSHLLALPSRLAIRMTSHLAGHVTGTVTKDVQKVMNVGQQTGPNVNISKCELVNHPGCFVTHPTLLSFPTNFWSSAISPHGS